MAIIGGILAFVGAIGWLIFWIISIIKPFKAGDTLWGVLDIFINPICGLIYFFMKGHKKLGIYWIIALILFWVGYGFVIGGAIQASGGIENLQNLQPAQ